MGFLENLSFYFKVLDEIAPDHGREKIAQKISSRELVEQGISIPPVKKKSMRNAFDEPSASTSKGKGKRKHL